MIVPRGEMRLRVEATVETEPELAVNPGAPFTLVQDLPDSALQYLLPSRYCPSDTLESRAREIVGTAVARIRPGRGDPRLDPGRHRVPLRHQRRLDRRRRDARARRRRVPRLRARRHRPDARAAHPGAHGRRLPARPRADGPARLVRGLRRRPLVHLRCDPGASRAAAASSSPTGATPPTSPSSRTTVRSRRWRCRSGSRSRRRPRPLPPAPPPLAAPA